MKFNTYIKLSSFIVALFFTTTACDDKLDLSDPNATGDVIALQNDKNVKTTLIGAYNQLSAGGFFGGNTFRNSELLAANGEIVFSGTFNDVADIARKQTITANADVTATWTAAYSTINVANNILSALAVVNEEDQDLVEGEALFLRGVCYFELIQLYAQPYSAGDVTTNLGVPIMLVEDRNSTAPKARSTVEAVYNQIIDDLTTAEVQLADGPTSGKATKQAAAAFLSRVYLQMGEFANARDAANRVIESEIYTLRPTYSGAFNTSSTSEDIFDIPVSTIDGVNNMNTFFASTSNGGRGDIEIQASHLALYNATDARLDFFYIDPATGDTRSGKWINRFGSVKVIRLAEMYLTRAECNIRLSTAIGDSPLNDINAVRERVLPPLGAVTLADVLLERKLELAHEGQRLHDAKRLEESIVEGPITYTFDHELLVFPIPQRERNINPALEQNPGYGN